MADARLARLARTPEPVRCAAHGCRSCVKPGQIMCKDHWFALPEPMRLAIWRAWRTVQNWPGKGDVASMAKTANAYGDAVRVAVEYLDLVPPTPAAAMKATAIDVHGWPVSFHQGRLL